jgi:hypothetical protein
VIEGVNVVLEEVVVNVVLDEDVVDVVVVVYQEADIRMKMVFSDKNTQQLICSIQRSK